MTLESKEKLHQQITDSAGSVIYTFSAHWDIVNRLKGRFALIKLIQIALTALSTGGFLASIISGIPSLSWMGGATSAVALGLNLYMLNFDLPSKIQMHTDAANELWDVREAYKSLLVDFDDLEPAQIRAKRDELITRTSEINKKYPETDSKSFRKAQVEIGKYEFEDGEAARLLHIENPHSSQREK